MSFPIKTYVVQKNYVYSLIKAKNFKRMKIIDVYEINLKLIKQSNLWNYYMVNTPLRLDFMNQINIKTLNNLL